MTLKVILLILAGTINVLFALVAFARSNRRFSAISFTVVMLAIGAWSVGIAGFMLATDPTAAIWWAKFYYTAPLFIALGTTWFVFGYPTYTFKQMPLFWKLFTTAGLLAILVPLLAHQDYLTQSLVYHDWGKEIVLNHRAYALYTIYFVGCYVFAQFVAFRRIRLMHGIAADEYGVYYLCTALAGVMGMTFNLILPWFGNYRLIWVGPVAVCMLTILISLNMARHKMFSLRFAAYRYVGYGFSLLALVSFYGLIVFTLARLIFKLQLSLSAIIFLSVVTGVVGLYSQQLKKRFDRITNQVFYQDAYDPQELNEQLNKVLVSSVDLELVMEESTAIIGNHLHAEFCGIILQQEGGSQRIFGPRMSYVEHSDLQSLLQLSKGIKSNVMIGDYLEHDSQALMKEMSNSDIGVLVRLTRDINNEAAVLGYMVLGNKKSGAGYTQQDVKTLDVVANGLVLAIQNALQFEEIQHFNTDLQVRIDEATRKLRHSNEQLKALDETKDNFISMASHQLRTPLTSIKGYISMVLEEDAGKLSKLQHDMLNQAFLSSQRVIYLVSDILNVSRIKAGNFTIEPSKLNLADMVQQELEQLQDMAASRQLTISYDRPRSFPSLMLDETKIRQVVMTFVENAIHYTPAGGHINVQLLDNPETIELTVKDNGIGVPKTERHHLFSKFYRATNARKARPDGTGLGLFMAKKVIIAHEGSLLFESQEGKGSTFGFKISKTKTALKSEEQPLPAVEPLKQAKTTTKKT